MVTIYHNPRCSKSRQTLALLEEKGLTPEVVLYVDQPPSPEQLSEILAKLDLGPRELIRTGEDAYKQHNLADLTLTDDQLINAMCENPKLIQRPIVVNGKKAALGRPPEQVLDIL